MTRAADSAKCNLIVYEAKLASKAERLQLAQLSCALSTTQQPLNPSHQSAKQVAASEPIMIEAAGPAIGPQNSVNVPAAKP